MTSFVIRTERDGTGLVDLQRSVAVMQAVQFHSFNILQVDLLGL